jgi:hypothetical protein
MSVLFDESGEFGPRVARHLREGLAGDGRGGDLVVLSGTAVRDDAALAPRITLTRTRGH